MEIKKDNKNELMNRREITAILTSEKNPDFADIAKKIAEKFKATEDQIIVNNIKGKFGRDTFLIKVDIYDTKELKDEAVKRLIKPKKAGAASAA